MQEAEVRRISVRSQPRQIVHETLSPKNPSQKRAGGVAQCVDLTSSPSTAKTNKNPKTQKLRSREVICHRVKKLVLLNPRIQLRLPKHSLVLLLFSFIMKKLNHHPPNVSGSEVSHLHRICLKCVWGVWCGESHISI
jgi:hypothetical protein